MHETIVKRESIKSMSSIAATRKSNVNGTFTKLTIAEQIAAALRTEIVTGQLPPGTRLLQIETAQRFEVSTTPVREAFGFLQRDGLVQIDTHRGVTVFLPTVKDLIEHYEIRMALEMLAAEKTARCFRAEDAPPLAALLDEMRATTDAVFYVQCNQQFHLRLYTLSGRSRLVRMIEDLRTASLAYNHLYAAADVPRDAQRLDDEHREILTACQAKDPVRAAGAVRHHIQQTIVHVAKLLEQAEHGGEE